MSKIDVFDTCLICGSSEGLERHHVFYGRGLRQLSEKWGMVAILCHRCHRGTHGVHLNHELDLELKQEFQRRFEQTHSREEFMAIFGRNWLE